MGLDLALRARRGAFALEARLACAAGEVCAVVGSNGAGKSTLLAAIAGLVRPDDGHVTLDGVDLDRAGAGRRRVHVPPRRRPIGVVFQDRLLFPHLDALDNTAFPLRARGVAAAEARARAQAALDDVGVGHKAAARPAALSGGEAQRVALARALVTRPRLLLLDEPLAALDGPARARIVELLQSIVARFDGIALWVTHDPRDVRAVADTLVVVEGGAVAEVGPAAAVLAAPRSAFLRGLVGPG